MILDSPSLSDELEPLPICGEVPVLGDTCKDVGLTVLACIEVYAGRLVSDSRRLNMRFG